MRPPEEIAADCENVHGGEYRSLLREAAEALREGERTAQFYAAESAAPRLCCTDRDALLAVARVLRRLRQWDHLDTAGDGLYWKREIDAALAALPEHPRRQVES
jgi:hypothetical protein